ncbi:MAG: polysaccharide pyruvyl transferase family protein [Anaerohalosphaeraceae bacterium]|nr:polysaccharide pyruvyl transferase family protein [Anaerohalosphaeraceae bacterium]
MKDIPTDIPGLWENYKKILTAKGVTTPIVVLHGGYGKNNMGDDAILDVLISRVRNNLSNAKIIVICHGPEYVRAQYDVVSWHFKSFQAFKAIVKSHIYIIGGGGIVNKINTYSGYRYCKIFDMKGKFLFIAALLAKIFRAQTLFYAIGATSFPDSAVKFLARLSLNFADVVSVRDQLSMDNLKAIGVKKDIVQVLDPALSLVPADKQQAQVILNALGVGSSGKRIVGFNMRYVRDSSVDNDDTVAEAAKLVDYLMRDKDCEVLFLPISRHLSEHFEDDFDFGMQVKARLSDDKDFYILQDYYHPATMMAILGLMDFCILERLHAVILSFKMGTPFFVISYDNKVAEFVKQIGRENSMMDLKDFSAEKVKVKLEGDCNV